MFIFFFFYDRNDRGDYLHVHFLLFYFAKRTRISISPNKKRTSPLDHLRGSDSLYNHPTLFNTCFLSSPSSGWTVRTTDGLASIRVNVINIAAEIIRTHCPGKMSYKKPYSTIPSGINAIAIVSIMEKTRPLYSSSIVFCSMTCNGVFTTMMHEPNVNMRSI